MKSDERGGYYRFPTILDDTIAFVSEDDLWCVSAEGGIARRLTSGLGSALHPAYSRDRKWLAFSGREEGPLEVWVMPAEGGQPRRVTFLGASLGSTRIAISFGPDLPTYSSWMR